MRITRVLFDEQATLKNGDTMQMEWNTSGEGCEVKWVTITRKGEEPQPVTFTVAEATDKPKV